MNEEGRPTLSPLPGVDLDRYVQVLHERFGNPAIADTLARLCAETSDRIPKWLLPVVRDNLANGRSVGYAAAIVASWARYAAGIDEMGAPIDVVDELRAELVPLAQSYAEDGLAFLRNSAVFGDLIEQPDFVAAYEQALSDLYSRGARQTLERLLA